MIKSERAKEHKKRYTQKYISEHKKQICVQLDLVKDEALITALNQCENRNSTIKRILHEHFGV